MFGGGQGFPFEDFMGGAGGFPGGGRPQKRGPVDNKKYYELVGVDKDATFDQIKKAYRKKAIRMHPDKGGDPEAFKELTQAYEVIGDKDKRELYDQGGVEAVQQGAARGGGGGHGDIFSQMFGGGGGGQARGPQQGKSVQHAIKVTLEEIYKGKTSKIAVNRDRICTECEGKGGKNGAESTCQGCRGRGQRTQMTMLGPGMYSQSTGPCTDCEGTGQQISEADKCKNCNGKKVMKEKKVLECVIDKGSPHGEKYVFHGESDEHPDKEPGHVIIQVNEQPHKVYQRKGADLLIEKKITLQQALTGVDFAIDYLDGTKIRVKSPKGVVVKPDMLMTIEDKGLPFHKQPYKFGNLFVLFTIEFPDSLNDAQVGSLATLFSGMKRPSIEGVDVAETITLQRFSKDQENSHAQGGTRAKNDSDNEEEEDPRMRGGQKVQCQQQ